MKDQRLRSSHNPTFLNLICNSHWSKKLPWFILTQWCLIQYIECLPSWNDREQIDDACKRDCINYLLSIFACIYSQDLRYDHGSDVDKKTNKQTNKKTRVHLYLKLEIISVMNSRIRQPVIRVVFHPVFLFQEIVLHRITSFPFKYRPTCRLVGLHKDLENSVGLRSSR